MDNVLKSRLSDMKGYAEKAVTFVGDMSLSDFLKDDLTRFAVTRAVEIVGEAATHIDADYRRATAQIPWQQITGVRIILAHAYARRY